MGTSYSSKNRTIDNEIKEKIKQAKLFPHTSAPWQQLVLTSFLKGFKNEGTCLDAASGVGNNIPTLINVFKKIYIIDRSPAAIEFSKNRYSSLNQEMLHFSVGNLENLPYQNSYFDCIVCTEALEHVQDPALVIKELQRVLKPGGYMLLSFQNHLNLSAILKFIYEEVWRKNWDAWGTHGHDEGYENYITSLGIKKILSQLKLSVIKVLGADYFNAWLSWVPFIYRNYKILDKYPLMFLGRLPFVKYFGMDFFILTKKNE